MSYNIDSVEVVHRSEDFSITVLEFERVRDLCSDDEGGRPGAPEGSIFALNWKRELRDGRLFPKESFDWYGEWSGYTLDKLVEVLAAFDGEVDLVLTWEGGDSFSGLRLRDHKVTQHKVIESLGEEQGG